MFSVRPVAVAAAAHCAKCKQLNLQCHPSIQPSRKLTTHLPFYRNFKMLTYLNSTSLFLLRKDKYSFTFPSALSRLSAASTHKGYSMDCLCAQWQDSRYLPPLCFWVQVIIPHQKIRTLFIMLTCNSLLFLFFAFCVFHLDYFKVSWSHKKH